MTVIYSGAGPENEGAQNTSETRQAMIARFKLELPEEFEVLSRLAGLTEKLAIIEVENLETGEIFKIRQKTCKKSLKVRK